MLSESRKFRIETKHRFFKPTSPQKSDDFARLQTVEDWTVLIIGGIVQMPNGVSFENLF